jgi:hypothetical protein
MLGRMTRVLSKTQQMASLELPPISPLRQQTKLQCFPPPPFSVPALFVEVDVCLSSKQGRVGGTKCPNQATAKKHGALFLFLFHVTFEGDLKECPPHCS